MASGWSVDQVSLSRRAGDRRLTMGESERTRRKSDRTKASWSGVLHCSPSESASTREEWKARRRTRDSPCRPQLRLDDEQQAVGGLPEDLDARLEGLSCETRRNECQQRTPKGTEDQERTVYHDDGESLSFACDCLWPERFLLPSALEAELVDDVRKRTRRLRLRYAE